jgi:hypothetical protein
VKHVVPILLTLVLAACGGGGGSGTTTTPPPVPTTLALTKVLDLNTNNNTVYNQASGDLNGDGLEDVVVSGWSFNSTNAHLWVFIQNADGTLTDQTANYIPANSFSGSQHVFIADMDSDGHNDIIVPGFRDGSATYNADTIIFWNQPGTTFAPQVLGSTQAHGACVDDINNDGKLDLIASGGGVFLNAGARTFNLNTALLQGNTYFSACTVSHQSNGDVSLVLGNNCYFGCGASSDNIFNYTVSGGVLTFKNALQVTGTGNSGFIDAVTVNNNFIFMYNSPSSRVIYSNTGPDTFAYSSTLDTLGNDYYAYTTTVNTAPALFFAGNQLGSRIYTTTGALTVFDASAFTDMSGSASDSQAGGVYHNADKTKLYLFQLFNNAFYVKELL